MIAAVACLLVLHAALVAWGIAQNSVTFDENAHVPSGVAYVARGNPWISVVNPPLVKIAFGAAALIAGARVPAGPSFDGHDQFTAGEAFMRANADHYHRIFAAARVVTLLLSLILAWLVWRTAYRLYGSSAALLALALYVMTPETLAHGGLATLDLPTALGAFGTLLAWFAFARAPSWRAWAVLAAAFSGFVLTRFSAWLVWGLLVLLAALAVRWHRSRLRDLWLGVLALLPVAWMALQFAYLGQTSYQPLASHRVDSARFQRWQHQAPELVIPVPDAYLLGLDHQLFESQPGITATYLFGHISKQPVPSYTPIALAVKWPLALWIAVLCTLVVSLSRKASRMSGKSSAAEMGTYEEIGLLLLALGFVASTLLVSLNVGVRYLLPALPPVIVLAARWLRDQGASAPALARRVTRVAAIGIALLIAEEAAATAPNYLSFFNVIGGGPGNGDRIVNDSNVDVGQGLIALRREMRRLGIGRIHLAYHGTVDPALYGIDYVPYRGGQPGSESDWIAISSYYFVGLEQRMMTRTGRTPFIAFDFEPLWVRPPAARPAGCMYVYRLR